MISAGYGSPYHPMTQEKIERYHRTMKNMITLKHFYLLWKLEKEIKNFVEFYNNHRYYESLDNLKPVDVYERRAKQILSQREEIKKKTLEMRKRQNLTACKEENHTLTFYWFCPICSDAIHCVILTHLKNKGIDARAGPFADSAA
jgi:hypothetical protein